MRSEFEIYKKEVEIETMTGKKKYILLPLRGRFLPKLMSLVSKFNGKEESEILASLDDDTMLNLHQLVFETLKYSLKVENEEELEALDMFVSQNVFKFLQPLMEVNFGENAKEE